MKNKVSYLLTVFIFLFSLTTRAVYIENYPVTLTQPNGKIIHCFASGDEYYNWVHDSNNYTIIKDNSTGYYVYAISVSGELKPSKFIVGAIDPAKAGLTKGINLSDEKIIAIRNDKIKNTPQAPVSQKAKRSGMSPYPNKGTINNIVIFIRFKGESEFTDPVSMYNSLYNAGPGNNSLKSFYLEASYNTLTINTTFYPIDTGTTIISYQDTAHTRSYYEPFDTNTNPTGYKSGEQAQKEQTLLAQAVNAVSSQIPTSLNIDYNNDGNVDNICFVVDGGYTAWNTLLWPHMWVLYTQNVYLNGKRVWNYNFQLRDFLQSSGAGVICHEMFHTLGAPDLYHYNTRPVDPVGKWDLMDNTTNPPQSMGAYMKYRFGNWISSIPEITTCGRYTLNPVTSSTGQVYKIATSGAPNQYFVLEYRLKQGVFESSVPGTGLLIYRIDSTVDGNASGPPDNIYIYRPNGDTNHNGVTDSAYFGLNYNKTNFNYTTNPRCFLEDGSNGGIDISDISWAGNTVSFNVNFINTKPVADFQMSSSHACTGKTINLTDFSSCFANGWQWTITPNTYSFVNSTNATSENPQLVFNADGVYNVTLKASNTYGNSSKTYQVNVGTGVDLPFTENFESGQLSTNNWEVVNPDTSITWALTQKAKVAGVPTTSVYMNFFNYSKKGAKDELISRNILLGKLTYAQLKFSVAYRRATVSTNDSLEIFVSTDCGNTFDSLPVYKKGGAGLATVSNSTTEFFPNAKSDWRTDSVDLSSYVNKNIVIEFKSVNENGNNLFLDNINVGGYTLPVAGFIISDTQICQHNTITYHDTSTGTITSRVWNFPGGKPQATSDSSPVVTYDSAGIFNVSLTVYYMSYNNKKTYYNHIYIDSIPATPVLTWDYKNYLLRSSFSKDNTWYNQNGIITGAGSQTYKPIASGIYYVIIDNNGCLSKSSDTIKITTGLNENAGQSKLSIYPNPSDGDFIIEFSPEISGVTNIKLTDEIGRTVFMKSESFGTGQNKFYFKNEDLPSGIYFLQVSSQGNSSISKIIIK